MEFSRLEQCTNKRQVHIEQIQDSKFISNQPYFLVKWKGFPKQFNSWLSLNDLQRNLTLQGCSINELSKGSPQKVSLVEKKGNTNFRKKKDAELISFLEVIEIDNQNYLSKRPKINETPIKIPQFLDLAAFYKRKRLKIAEEGEKQKADKTTINPSARSNKLENNSESTFMKQTKSEEVKCLSVFSVSSFSGSDERRLRPSVGMEKSSFRPITRSISKSQGGPQHQTSYLVMKVFQNPYRRGYKTGLRSVREWSASPRSLGSSCSSSTSRVPKVMRRKNTRGKGRRTKSILRENRRSNSKYGSRFEVAKSEKMSPNQKGISIPKS